MNNIEQICDYIKEKGLYRSRCQGGIYLDELTGNRFDVYHIGYDMRIRQTFKDLTGLAYNCGFEKAEDLDKFLALIPYEVK
jgi:hypothetical protein